MTTTAPNPAQREILARAEQRLPGMVARRAPHDLVLSAMAAYEAMYDAAGRPGDQPDADLDALVDVVNDTDRSCTGCGYTPPAADERVTGDCAPGEHHLGLVPAALLENARAERARRQAVAR